MKAIIYIVILIIVVIFGVTFALKNPQSVDITYYGGFAVNTYLTLVLAISLIVGIVLGWLFTQMSVVKAKREIRRANKQVRKSQKELDSLRALAERDTDATV